VADLVCIDETGRSKSSLFLATRPQRCQGKSRPLEAAEHPRVCTRGGLVGGLLGARSAGAFATRWQSVKHLFGFDDRLAQLGEGVD
jgi:hypothetical protein